MRRLSLFLLPLSLALLCCNRQPTDDERGMQLLALARDCYARGHYAAARDTILNLRRRFPLAFEARRQAILLLDSVELQDAAGDTLKEQFYRRKLDFDRAQATQNDDDHAKD